MSSKYEERSRSAENNLKNVARFSPKESLFWTGYFTLQIHAQAVCNYVTIEYCESMIYDLGDSIAAQYWKGYRAAILEDLSEPTDLEGTIQITVKFEGD